MTTVSDIIVKSKWLAREHAAELDPLEEAEWMFCLASGWKRLWALHPEAFHVSARVGVMPDVPVSSVSPVTLADGWDDVLAAAAALAAVRSLRPADETQANIRRGSLDMLENAVMAGMGAA